MKNNLRPFIILIYFEMKRLVVFILLTILIMCTLFAENLQFNVHWLVNNIKTTTIQILPYSGTGTLPKEEDIYIKSIDPTANTVPYNVCLIKYTTNVKGTHKIEFSATPMESTLTSKEHPYSLYITYGNGFPVILNVDPTELDNSKAITFSVIGSGETTADIYLDAVLTDLYEMQIGEYSSTVTISRTSE